METNIFKVILEAGVKDFDSDGCPFVSDENEFENIYPDKKSAIKYAQKKFSKRGMGAWTEYVHCFVLKLTISEQGIIGRNRIYNLFKENKDFDIWE